MSFRAAKPEDAIFVAQLLRRFYQEAGDVYGIPYDHASCIRTVLDTIVNGICIVGQRSCAGALIAPFAFNVSAKIAHVIFWRFEPRRELAIFDQLYEACQKAGADYINAAALAPRQTGKRFYAVRDMHLVESHFLGRLSRNGLHCTADVVKDHK